MNLILLKNDDFITSSEVKLSNYRHQHIYQVHKAQTGDQLTVGLINQSIGLAEVIAIDDKEAHLSILHLDQSPPPALALDLIIALPRPKMIKRILQTSATMGVKNIIFINSFRVEKSYWQSPLLKPEAINEQLILGLEQAKDTMLPKVTLEKRFKPFVEDRLQAITQDKKAFVAHPITDTPCPRGINEPCTLVIGPEGGFIPYEVDKLNEAGCRTIHLGDRILRTETALPVLLAKLFD